MNFLKHASVNFSFHQIVQTRKKNNEIAYQFNGRFYLYNNKYKVKEMDNNFLLLFYQTTVNITRQCNENA